MSFQNGRRRRRRGESRGQLGDQIVAGARPVWIGWRELDWSGGPFRPAVAIVADGQ